MNLLGWSAVTLEMPLIVGAFAVFSICLLGMVAIMVRASTRKMPTDEELSRIKTEEDIYKYL